jgi:hypothetical protein
VRQLAATVTVTTDDVDDRRPSPDGFRNSAR